MNTIAILSLFLIASPLIFAADSCVAKPIVRIRDSWISNGRAGHVIDLSFNNTGSCAISHIYAEALIPAGYTLESSWGFNTSAHPKIVLDIYETIPAWTWFGQGRYGIVLYTPLNTDLSSFAPSVLNFNCKDCMLPPTVAPTTPPTLSPTTPPTVSPSSPPTLAPTSSPSGCQITVVQERREGAEWQTDDYIYEIFDLTIKNSGTRSLTSAKIGGGSGLLLSGTPTSYWGMTKLSDSPLTFDVTIYGGGLAAGSSLTAGYISSRHVDDIHISTPHQEIILTDRITCA